MSKYVFEETRHRICYTLFDENMMSVKMILILCDWNELFYFLMSKYVFEETRHRICYTLFDENMMSVKMILILCDWNELFYMCVDHACE
jgi:hypothetical protein